MKNVMVVTLVVVGLALIATAGDLTPKQAMDKMMNCMACKPMNDYPDLGMNIRYDVHDTEDGFVSSFLMTSEKLMPSFIECEKKCDVLRAEAMKLTAEETAEKLCPFCIGMMQLMARDDVRIESFDVAMGKIMVASSDTEEGVDALHDYAAMARETSALLAQAAMGMAQPKETETQQK